MGHYDERRRLPRRRTRLSAIGVYGETLSAAACTIRDRSEHGARLLTGPGAVLPDAFTLIELTSGEAFDAKVVWRDAAFVGVTLQDPRPLSPPRNAQDRQLLEIRNRATAKGASAKAAI